MSPTTSASGPGRGTRFHDPIAIALGNASLLGAGYALLGSWVRAFVTAAVSVVLLVAIGVTDGAGWWFQGVLLLWWACTIAHGWYFARRRGTAAVPAESPEPDWTSSSQPAAYAPPDAPTSGDDESLSPRRQRLITFGVALPVLLVFGLLRVDAWRIEQAADEAHRAGECGPALSRLDGLWFGHRLADAPLTVRADATTEACERLRRAEQLATGNRLGAEAMLRHYAAHPAARWDGVAGMRADLLLAEAGDELGTALTGDLEALDTGFEELSTVLDEFPDRRGDVDEVLGPFLDGLPTEDSCDTARITGRLDDRLSKGDDLSGVLDVVGKTEPKALVGCGDDLLKNDDPHEAKKRYQQLLSDYPKHRQVAAAEKGLVRANQGIELENVTELLHAIPYGTTKPAYCENPAPYSGAKPYRGNGPHPTLLYGKDGHRSKLPSSWKADGAADAVLVVCIGSRTMGTVVETCSYSPFDAPYDYTQVSFHKKKFPVKVYEVRTGKLVDHDSIQIDGDSCPSVVTYYGANPPSDKYVTSSSKAEIRDGYRPLIDP